MPACDVGVSFASGTVLQAKPGSHKRKDGDVKQGATRAHAYCLRILRGTFPHTPKPGARTQVPRNPRLKYRRGVSDRHSARSTKVGANCRHWQHLATCTSNRTAVQCSTTSHRSTAGHRVHTMRPSSAASVATRSKYFMTLQVTQAPKALEG